MENESVKSAGVIGKAGQFFSECRDELRKVVKPTKDETIRATGVTIFILLFVALVLCVFDIFFNSLMNTVFGV